MRAALVVLLAATNAAIPPLPWRDAAPAPPLPEDFARAVMPPVVLSAPGMDKVRYSRGLKYTDVAHPDVLMDVYEPAEPARGKGRPVVLFVHGGTDTRARPKDWGIYQSWGRLVAARGSVAVTFTHRLGFPRTQVREGAADVAAALGYVARNASRFGADPTRICIAAFSAGGPMLSPYMIDAPPSIRCLVGYYPFMDIRQTEHHQESEDTQTREAYSNILQVAKQGRRTPLFLVRAGRDEIPTLLDSVDRFAVAALAANYPLTLVNHPDGPHGFDNQTGDARSREILEATLDFLERHLEE